MKIELGNLYLLIQNENTSQQEFQGLLNFSETEANAHASAAAAGRAGRTALPVQPAPLARPRNRHDREPRALLPPLHQPGSVRFRPLCRAARRYEPDKTKLR